MTRRISPAGNTPATDGVKPGWAERLVASWCQHRAETDRKTIERCRTAYKDPTLNSLANQFANIMERHAKDWKEAEVMLRQLAEAKES